MLLLSSTNVSKYSFRKNQPKLDIFETRAQFCLMTVGDSEHREGVHNYWVLALLAKDRFYQTNLLVYVCVTLD